MTDAEIRSGASRELAMSFDADSSDIDSDQTDEASDMDVGSDIDCKQATFEHASDLPIY